MGTCLADSEYKNEFAVVFTRFYDIILQHYIDDDCEHSTSIAGLTVQFYTVSNGDFCVI
jgi:hypothetical protein